MMRTSRGPLTSFAFSKNQRLILHRHLSIVGDAHKPKNKTAFKVAIIPGDGVGKIIVPAVKRVLDALWSDEIDLQFVTLNAGFETFQKTGNSLSLETIETLKTCDGAIFGAVSSPKQKISGYVSPIVNIRKALGLYANLRPVTSLITPPYSNSKKKVDVLVVRENTECLYVQKERLEDKGEKAIAERHITHAASSRIAQIAFDQAKLRAKQREEEYELEMTGLKLGASPRSEYTKDLLEKKPKVTIVHHANVLSVSDGLFLRSCLEVSKRPENSGIITEEALVDTTAHDLILKPDSFDVVVAPNLYGDILSDQVAAMGGGLGLVPSANIGEGFILTHGSNLVSDVHSSANPLGAIRGAAMLLRALGQGVSAAAVDRAVQIIISELPEGALRNFESSSPSQLQSIVDDITEKVIKHAHFVAFSDALKSGSA